MWLFSIQFVPCYLIYRSSILYFLFPRNVYSRIFFFHLCGTNNFQNEKVNILYNEYRFANISSTERGLSSQRCNRNFRRGNERSRRKSENDEAKRKRRARDQRFTSSFLSKLGFDLFVAQFPLVPHHREVPSLLDFLVFYGCTNKGFEGIALPMAREK